MARAIRAVRPAEGQNEALEAVTELGSELEKDREALSHFLELLRLLDERGILRLLRDVSRVNEEVVRVGVEWLSRPGSVRAIQNLRVLLATLERIEPARLQKALADIGQAMERAADVAPVGPRLGAIALLRQLGEPETNRGLRVMLAILKDFGTKSA